MPAHKMHLAIAAELNKYLKLDNDLLMLGSVLPDLTINHTHRLSHCRNDKNGIKGLANPKKFLQIYENYINNPLIMGYLIHLLTDEFFNKYIYEKYYLFDSENSIIGVKINGQEKYIDKNVIKDMKHNDFKLYDKYLLYRKKVLKFKNKKCYKDVVNLDIAKFDENNLRKYVNRLNNEINIFNRINPLKKNHFQILNVEELNEQYVKCCNYIMNFINDIKSKGEGVIDY